ncbi:O-antigen ligase family protein [Novosphingobium resinovorum]|uniref:O-antigen ligase family protein n=1 Tax=Novosphingobium resinovorum TaxID=158500 RepID=UPI002ED28A01|nr:O-antigen ligase family protein [Novosphingobium resinovorum]
MNEDTAARTPLAVLAMVVAAAFAFVLAKPGFHAACVSTLGVILFVSSLRLPLRQEMALRAVLMTFLMPVVAWLLPSVWLLYAVMALWVPVFAGRMERIAGVYLFSLLLLPALEMPVELGGLKLFDLGVHDALALGATFAVLSHPARARIAPADDIRVGCLLLALVFISARDTSFTHALRSTINVTIDYGLPYYILSRTLKDGETMRAAMRWLACAASGLAILLAYEAWRNWPIYNELYWHLQVPMVLIVKTRGALLRAGGPFNEPTSIALVMALCLVALWLLRDDFRSRRRHGLLCLAVFVGVSAPQSRNAWIALALAVLLGDVFLGRWRALVRKFAPTAMVLGIVLAAASVSPSFSESLGLSGQGSDTADYRRDLLHRGSEEFWGSPLVGFSGAQLEVRLEDMRQGEGIIDYVNTYLWFGLFGGAAGLWIFVWNLFAPLSRLWRGRRLAFASGGAAPAAFVFGCLATLSLALFFASFGNRPSVLMFGFFGFAAAIRALGRRQAVSPAGAVPWTGAALPA